MRHRLFARIAALAIALAFACPIASDATTVSYYGNLVGGTVSATTGAFSGAITTTTVTASTSLVAPAITLSGASGLGTITRSGSSTFLASWDSNNAGFDFVSFNNVAWAPVGTGTITAHGDVNSTGNLSSGSLTTNTISATGGITGAGITSSSTGGFGMPNSAAGCNTLTGTGGGAVAGVSAQAWYLYVPCIGQYTAVDNAGNLGVQGGVFANSGFFGPGSGLSANSVPKASIVTPPTLFMDSAGTVHPTSYLVSGVASDPGVNGTAHISLPFVPPNGFYILGVNNVGGGSSTTGLGVSITGSNSFSVIEQTVSGQHSALSWAVMAF
jgi:hypothetical protein